MYLKYQSLVAYSKVWSCKAVRCRNVVGCLGGVGVIGVNVGQQGAHDCRYSGAHVFRRQTRKVAANKKGIHEKTLDPNNFENVLFMQRDITSWLGRWTPPHNAWQTHPLFLGESPQNKLSKHRPLWHRESSPHQCSGCLLRNEIGSREKTERTKQSEKKTTIRNREEKENIPKYKGSK